MSGRWSLWPRTPRQLAERIWLRSAPYAQERLRERPGTEQVAGGSSGVCVSLTTYGKRTERAHLTIESIAVGRLKPSRIVLWLDDEDWKHPTPALKRLADRGLELMRARAEWGPHKKYYPYCVASADDGLLLVTADDDVFYPRRWLADLVAATGQEGEVVVAHRARRIAVGTDGLEPYSRWKPVTDTEPSHLNLAVGVGGVAYPPRLQQVLRDAGDEFMRTASRADDLWLKLHELRSGFPVAQVRARAADFPLQIGSQRTALSLENQLGDRNDTVVEALYKESDLARLVR